MFIDRAKIFARSGKGGKGCVSFMRQKYMPKGGPDGGNGGNGGNIILKGNRNLNTLFSFKYNKSFCAENGGHGEGSDMHGKNAKDMTIQLPIGTLVHTEHGMTIEIINEEPIVLLKGGRGGVGNGCLANSVHQMPRFSHPPAPSEEMFLDLELKLIGDVGLVGYPNAGKSSFINSCTNANSLVANYQFTTLEPKLGTYENIIIVDIPGIIEGASLGKGLGLQFLSHIERCKFLLYVVDISNKPLEVLKSLKTELDSFFENKTAKPFIIALNKIELLTRKNQLKIKYAIENLTGAKVFPISVHKKVGIKKLLTYLTGQI